MGRKNGMNTLQRLLVLALVLFVGTGVVFAGNTYVGVKKCMACHKVPSLGGLAYSVWEKTPHAKAFEVLKTKAADDIAKGKGLTKPAAESPECLKCHVTGQGTAVKEEGVTCEACHGAASGYLMLHNKKTPEDKAKAVAAGLMIGDDAKKACEGCHNSGSPTFKGFKFAEMWPKIEHTGPAKK